MDGLRFISLLTGLLFLSPSLEARFATPRLGRGFIQESHFSEEKLRERTDALRQEALKTQQENMAKINRSDDPLAMERRAVEVESQRSDTCQGSQLAEKFNEGLEKACHFTVAIDACGTKANQLDTIVASSENLKNSIIETFKTKGSQGAAAELKKQLMASTRQAIAANKVCADTVEQTIMSAGCLTAYDTIFDREAREQISNGCTADSIDADVLNIVTYMQELGESIVTLQNNHIASRMKEATIASHLVCANSLEEVLVQMRMPASDRQGRPMPAPRIPEICKSDAPAPSNNQPAFKPAVSAPEGITFE